MKLFIARDKCGKLCMYDEIPLRIDHIFIVNQDCVREEKYKVFEYGYIEIESSLFPEVTWENSPQLVELKLSKQ